jgi:hypothetical protein
MTKIDIIKKIIETKDNELEVAYKAIKIHTETVIIPGYKAIADKYFNDFSNEDIYTRVSSDGETVTFLRPHVDYNYDKDIMELRLSTDWKTGEITDVRTSVYSTSDNSVWELERLQLVGQVASVLIDYKDDFIAEMMSFKTSKRTKVKQLRKVGYDIERDIRSCEEQINSIEREETLAKLNGKGLVFGEGKKGSIDLKWNWTLRNVNSARIVSTTASGKSADIEIQSYDYKPEIYKNVRMSNIESLVWQYRDYVLKAAV